MTTVWNFAQRINPLHVFDKKIYSGLQASYFAKGCF